MTLEELEIALNLVQASTDFQLCQKELRNNRLPHIGNLINTNISVVEETASELHLKGNAPELT